MATMLYRLGTIAARRAKTVIAAWFVMLLAAVAAFAGFGGQLTDQISVPELETTRVADRLAEELPEMSGGSANTVFRTSDGEPFTEGQINATEDLLRDVEENDIIQSTTSPFATETELAEGRQELEEAREQLEELPEDFSVADARQDIDEGREELEQASAEVEAGWEELEDGLAAGGMSLDALAESRGEIEGGLAALDEADEELDAQVDEALAGGYWPAVEDDLNSARAEVVAEREQLQAALAQVEQAEQGVAELEAAESELDEGRAELEAAEEELAQLEDSLDGDDPAQAVERGERALALAEGASMVSEDEGTAVAVITFEVPLEQVGTEDLEAVSAELMAADIDGVEILPSGDLNVELPHLFSVAEAIGLMIAAAVLVIMLGTFVGAGLPLLNAVVGVGIGVAGALSLSAVVEMMSMTPILGLMLGLAVGIDYSLFIIHRHRRQMKAGTPLRESIALATGTAGNAVVFAGATVVIALLALNVSGLPFLALMGTVAAACVAIAVLIAVTMTPALLSLVGHRILRRPERRYIGMQEHQRITTPMPTGKAVLIAAGALVLLAVMAVPTLSMRLGLPDASTEPEDSTGYQAYAATEEAFGQGMNGPLIVVADLVPDLSAEESEDLQLDLAEELSAHRHIDAAVQAGANDEQTIAVYQVIPQDGPASESVEELVHEFREGEVLSGDLAEQTELSVAGLTAANIDISDHIADAMPLYLGLVVGLSLVLMVMVFRSLLLPIIATLGFIGSVAAAMGSVVAVFQWGWLSDIFGISNPGPIVTFLPVIMIGILFGLAMDYQLFTASGMREAYVHGSAPRLAVRQGLHAGRSVVVAAALIMSSVFAGFIFTPDPMVAAIGMGLAVGVLLDAFIVRLLLVPALLHLCGPASWWLPKWLDSILPNVDVEGAKLERVLESESGAAEDAPVPAASRS
ncbi:MMPL family transporter [Nesterenkonia natronophila]|uniref:RND transporter n=1 Tax=Nesterenkonia natronophila TaxID=2174932 RepID=A0A3A4F4I1_9MICC|nr:MMPL family transporter [Nesterenkonia natronophila]RJN32716.1 RND transporter [Nesterenkonia natronophila]